MAATKAPAEKTKVRRPIPVPEPDLTPDELLRRAAAMREMLRDDQDSADARGHHSQEIQDAFVRAGFYRIVQPRLFGGYEFDYVTFYRVMAEISRGSPGIGWCLTLGASHAAVIAAHWPEEAQAELFGPTGHFVAPHRAGTPPTVRKVDGGYLVNGKWGYASGVPYSTHFLGNAALERDGEEPLPVIFVVPRAAYTIVDDWGGDKTLGMRASGSNSVVIEDVVVPEHMLVAFGRGLWSADDVGEEGTPGTRLHGNPMYLGRLMGPYHASLIVPVIGAARAAIDELEAIARARKTRFPPIVPWTHNADVQLPFGEAVLLADAAEALLIRGMEMYMDYCRRWADEGVEFSAQDSLRLWGMLIKAGRMAHEAVEKAYDAASSSAAMKGQRIERYYRDAAMYRSHSSAQFATFASGVARLHFGLPMGMFGI